MTIVRMYSKYIQYIQEYVAFLSTYAKYCSRAINSLYSRAASNQKIILQLPSFWIKINVFYVFYYF